MKTWIAVFPLLVLAGCATGPDLKTRMTAYIGASPQTLVEQVGVPDKQITTDGVQYLAYVREEDDVQPVFVFDGYGRWDGGFGGWPYALEGPVPFDQQKLVCETTFTVRHDRIASVGFRGNDCD